MGKIAFVFSGQGAQYSGMGQDLYNHFKEAQRVFDLAEVIRPGTQQQCFEGNKEELAQTINTQPCIFCVSLAAAHSLKAQGVQPDVLAGFSMGEITALTNGGVLDPEQGFKLICLRSQLMQKASEKNPGAMVAVLKLTGSQVEALCSQFTEVYPVNYNCPGQTVVALEQSQLKPFAQAVQSSGGKALTLPVGGGFHSPFMAEARINMIAKLRTMALQAPIIPVYGNKTAVPYATSESMIKETIADQITHPVYWQRSIENMIAAGVDTFIEVGPGKTLTNLIKKISTEVTALSVEDRSSLLAAVEYCSQAR